MTAPNGSSALSDAERARLYLLQQVKSLWPYISTYEAVEIVRYLRTGNWS